MEKTKTKKRTQLDEVPNLEVPINESVEQETWSPGQNDTRYVVVRGVTEVRVSDKDYPSSDDERAISERDFWQRVANRGISEKVSVVQYDKKKHRIW